MQILLFLPPEKETSFLFLLLEINFHSPSVWDLNVPGATL